jgi:hypothetical protein
VSKTRSLGICGYAQVGKDTAAAVAVRYFGFHAYSFAEPLKAACAELFDWGPEWFTGEGKARRDPRWGITPREALQLLGTEYGQIDLQRVPEFAAKTGRCLWARRVFESVKSNDHARVVISDLRFPHEVDEIRARRGQVVRVHRPGVGPRNLHESEIAVDAIEPDANVINDGTLGEFELRVAEVIAGLTGIRPCAST